MTTSVLINSLVRYKDERCEQLQPNPFQFSIPSQQTTKWKGMKNLPHSQNAYREAGGYEVTLDSLTVPAELMPNPEPMILYETQGINNSDFGHMTSVICDNRLCQQIIDPSGCNCGATYQLCTDYRGNTCMQRVEVCDGNIGCTGVPTAPTVQQACGKPGKSNLNNTWVAYYDFTVRNDAGEALFHMYKSKSVISMSRLSWYGCEVRVKIMDACGNVLEPDGVDLCSLCDYAKLFCKDNQVLASFTYHFVPSKSNFGPGCFSDNK